MKSYKHINDNQRDRIGILLAGGMSVAAVARRMKRHPSTIRREQRRSRPLFLAYSPLRAGRDAAKKRKCSRKEKKLHNVRLWNVVKKKLELRWSPEQIARYLKQTYPHDTSMHVSYETIYTYIYILPRGSLRKELISFLRQGSRGRQRRKRDTDERGKIPNMVSIRERPKEVARRTVPGHWESDLVVGKGNRSAIGTLVERTTRMTIIVPLKKKDAVSVRKAFAKTVKQLPKEAFRSITHDRGSEMSEHELFTKDTKVQVYFADPHSPWQRGTNENTNGLIRDFFPKGTDFSQVPTKYLKYVQRLLNERPRKTLDWQTPKESFSKLLFKKCALHS
jgi:IS30 family transposase